MVKLLKPGDSMPLMMPKMLARPRPMKITTATTLISANQNSLSPKPFTEKKLSMNISARKIALQYRPGTSGNQKLITSCAATSSAAMVTAQLYQ
ncbi:hypothetical protein D9M68_360940 [compost metagenome]